MTVRPVLVLGPMPPPIHGAALVTDAVVRSLRTASEAVEVIDTSCGGRSGLRYHGARLGRHLRAGVRIAAGRYAAVYVGGAGGPGLAYQTVSLVPARLRGLPIVFHHHSAAVFSSRSRLMSLLVAVASTRALHVVLGPAMETRLRHLYGAGRTVVVSNANFVPVEIGPAPAGQRGSGAFVLGHLCNLSAEKGLYRTLDVLRACVDAGLDVTLHLGGPAGPTDADAVERARHEFGSRLVVHGPVLGSVAKDHFFQQLDAFLFPSLYRHEAEPLVVLEAAAAAVPTISFDVGELPVLVARTGGVVVPQGGDYVGIAVAQIRAALSGAGELWAKEDVRRSYADLVSEAAGAWKQALDWMCTG